MLRRRWIARGSWFDRRQIGRQRRDPQPRQTPDSCGNPRTLRRIGRFDGGCTGTSGCSRQFVRVVVVKSAPVSGWIDTVTASNALESPVVTERGDLSPLPRRSPVAWLLIGGIRAYRLAFASRPSPCRFEPTCSAYGLEALRLHGSVRGSALIARRIVRCRPGGAHGYDPVPPSEPTPSAVRAAAASSYSPGATVSHLLTPPPY